MFLIEIYAIAIHHSFLDALIFNLTLIPARCNATAASRRRRQVRALRRININNNTLRGVVGGVAF
jgi:hypothetical protein